jgi:hypothetical protein
MHRDKKIRTVGCNPDWEISSQLKLDEMVFSAMRDGSEARAIQ